MAAAHHAFRATHCTDDTTTLQALAVLAYFIGLAVTVCHMLPIDIRISW
jgi:hypothetical protein